MADHSELVAALRSEAARAGLNPSDVLTAMSYETGGTLDPWKKGPVTQHGEHRGLIQWGEPQRKQYGITADMPVGDQVKASFRYLQDRGVKPGMGLLDIYSAINAGRVGLYNRTDANNGGAPGTVADKVATQMVGHRARANALLGPQPVAGEVPAAVPASVAAPAPAVPGALSPNIAVAPGQPGGGPAAMAGGAPLSLAPGGAAPAGDDGLAALAALAAIPGALSQDHGIQPVEMPAIQYFKPNARKLAAAMAKNPLG